MKRYAGSRTIDGIKVTCDGEPLNERFDLKRYTNAWLEWGYEGDAPCQLALALLADHTGDNDKALALAEPFMRAIVAELDNDWELSGGDIDDALRRLDKGE